MQSCKQDCITDVLSLLADIIQLLPNMQHFHEYEMIPPHSYRKCGDLEEELKNVTNNLKSLEAQSEKVSVHLCEI